MYWWSQAPTAGTDPPMHIVMVKRPVVVPGVGVTKPISFTGLFFQFLELTKHWLPTKYHIHIWQVSPQLSCGYTDQIYMWFNGSNIYFAKSNIPKGEIIIRILVSPTTEQTTNPPSPTSIKLHQSQTGYWWVNGSEKVIFFNSIIQYIILTREEKTYTSIQQSTTQIPT